LFFVDLPANLNERNGAEAANCERPLSAADSTDRLEGAQLAAHNAAS
jgi:hypothetical protein